MTWWQGLLIGTVIGGWITFALSGYAFTRMRVEPVYAEWLIAVFLAIVASLLFALSWT